MPMYNVNNPSIPIELQDGDHRDCLTIFPNGEAFINVQNTDLQDQDQDGEGYLPLGIFQDKYSEEMSFPTLFFGEKRPEDMTNNLSYQKIAKWEVLHKEHDFAYHTTNLFYKAVRIIVKMRLLKQIDWQFAHEDRKFTYRRIW